MTLKELLNKQGVCTPLELYVDDNLVLSADTEYAKNLIKSGDIRGEYTVTKFAPIIFNHFTGNSIVYMYVYTRSNKSAGTKK